MPNPTYTEEEMKGFRALAQMAAANLHTLPDRQRMEVLTGLIALPIKEAEEAAKLRLAMTRAMECQMDLFLALDLQVKVAA